MAFMKKIKNKDIEKARESFIEGADQLKEYKSICQKEWKNILLRIKSEAINEIDEFVKDRMGMTRTGWILEAVQEKIKIERAKK